MKYFDQQLLKICLSILLITLPLSLTAGELTQSPIRFNASASGSEVAKGATLHTLLTEGAMEDSSTLIITANGSSKQPIWRAFNPPAEGRTQPQKIFLIHHELVEFGGAGLECLDPPPSGNVGLDEAVPRIGRKMFIKGNLDSVIVLLQGTDAEVESSVRDTILSGKRANGFILATARAVASHVDRERLQSLFEMPQKHGTYS